MAALTAISRSLFARRLLADGLLAEGDSVMSSGFSGIWPQQEVGD